MYEELTLVGNNSDRQHLLPACTILDNEPGFYKPSDPFPNPARLMSVSHFAGDRSFLDRLLYLPNIV